MLFHDVYIGKQPTTLKNSYGERSFFYNPGHLLPSGTYFLTIKTHDGPNDKASQLDRENVFGGR